MDESEDDSFFKNSKNEKWSASNVTIVLSHKIVIASQSSDDQSNFEAFNIPQKDLSPAKMGEISPILKKNRKVKTINRLHESKNDIHFEIFDYTVEAD